ncbi:MAG: hypothetical protein HY335_06460 [Deinococcus sp.]|nr:hypothetical protein [Deinococcus sp.]
MWKVTSWTKGLCLVLAVALVAYPLDVVYAQVGPADRSDSSSQVIQLAGPFFENNDIQELAEELGFDLQRSFNFVRDQISAEIYQGVLRGALGTLWSRAGNTADKTVLLAALLEQAQIPHRFVLGSLDEATARQLVDAMFRSIPAELQPEPVATSETEQAILDRHQAFQQVVLQSADAQVLPLAIALANAGIAAQPEPGLDTLLAEAKAHVWLQYQAGERWVDLDPSFPDAEMGQVFATAETILPALPPELYHQLTIQVRVEQRADGQVSNIYPLAFATYPADLVGTEILFTHEISPSFIPSIMTLTPVLAVGDQQINGDPLDLINSVEDSFGGSTEVTGEWLEFVYTYPDGHTETTVREIFDRIGFVQRAAGDVANAELAILPEIYDTPIALTGLYSVLVAPGEVSSQVLDQWLLAAVNPTADAISAGQADSLNDDAVVGEQLVRFLHLINLSTILTADNLAQEQASAQGVRTYQASARINVVSADLQEAAGERQLALKLDLHRAGYRTTSPEGGAGLAQLRRGVLEAVLERVLLEQLFNLPVTSASGTLAQAQAQGTQLQVVTTDNVTQLGLSDTAVARIQTALSARLMVLAPGGALSPAAWWEVDPASGTTTAVNESGLHPSVVEYVVLVANVVNLASAITCAATMNRGICLATCVLSVVTLVAGALALEAIAFSKLLEAVSAGSGFNAAQVSCSVGVLL